MILLRSVDMNIKSKPEKKKWLDVITLLRNQLVHIATVALHAVNPAPTYLRAAEIIFGEMRSHIFI